VLQDRVVVVGVSGGIAAYKACELVRRLRERGAAVIVVMTPAACEFVTPLTFQALSGNPVVTTLWGDQKPRFELPLESQARVGGRVEHVDVAEVADCVVVAPATADLMARMVHGEAPDALTCLLLATRAPLVLAPAMDLQMWRAAATQANVRTLRARGARFVGPATGALASGLRGPGRLAETPEILAEVEQAMARRASLAGVRVLIGAGRTEEPLDPVRVLTNRSSGRMGFALAEAARDRGADVTVVAGPVSIEPPHGVALVPVVTAAQMQRALQGAAEHADVVLMAAAVADYRPRQVATRKLKRTPAPLALALTPNPDILAGLGAARRAGQVIVGFALETERGVANARAKLAAKGADLIVLNSPADGIGGATNRVTLVEARTARALPKADKREVAEAILDRVLALRAGTPAPAKVVAKTTATAVAKPAAKARGVRKGGAR
jgi:phosphopantothenoylcysteine decarboxylase/phosphopantothenate--cysteine ligase